MSDKNKSGGNQDEAAELAKQIHDSVAGLNKGVTALKEDISGMKQEISELKNVDTATVLEEFEKLKAQNEETMKAIRNNKNNPGFIAGLEDENEAKKFSMTKCLIAIKTGRWEHAGFEKEVLDIATKSAGQVIGVQSEGGFFVPDQVIADVITGFYAKSQFINLDGEGQTRVSVLDGLFGIPVKIPKFMGGVIAYWIGEEDEYVQSQSKVGNVTGTPKKLGALIRLTNEMQRFQGYGFETLLRNDMTRAMAKKADWTILYGTGTNDMPAGIFARVDAAKIAAAVAAGTIPESVQVFDANAGALWDGSTMADWALAELNYDGLDEMRGALEDNNIDIESSFATMACPKYFRRLKQLKVKNFDGQSSDEPYLIGIPMLTDNKLQDIIGTFGRSTQIKNSIKPGASLNGATTGAAKACDVVAGNFSEVLFGRWAGIEIEDDKGEGTGFIKDQTYIKARMYADVMFRHEASLVVCPNAKVKD